jgi:hypothetical protein
MRERKARESRRPITKSHPMSQEETMETSSTPETKTNSVPLFISTWDGFVEAIWETVLAVAIATAVCVGLANLSVHINEAQVARTAAVGQSASTPAI